MKTIRLGLVLCATLLASVGVAEAQQPPVKVGFAYAAAPWSWYDVKTTANKGAMIEVMSAIAKDAGFQVEFHGATTGDLIPMLGAKTVDVVSTVWTPSAARQAVADLSNPILSFGEGFMVSKSNPPALKTLADLKGKTVSAQGGTSYEQMLRGIAGITVKSVPIADGVAAVKSGEAVAVVGSQAQFIFLKQGGDLPDGIVIAEDYEPQIFQNVIIAVGKGNPDLLAKVNASLAKLTADGTLKPIFTKYGIDWTMPK